MNDLLVNGMLSDNGMTCVLDALVMPRSMAFWIWIMSSQVAPGHVHHRGGIDPYLIIGEMDHHSSERVDDLNRVLTRTGVTAAIAADRHDLSLAMRREPSWDIRPEIGHNRNSTPPQEWHDARQRVE